MDGLRKIANSEDSAISTLRDIKIGKWSLDQVREWLAAVFGSTRQPSVDCVLRCLTNSAQRPSGEKTEDNLLAVSSKTVATASKKRKYPENVPSFFGSTTISNRKRRYANETQDAKATSASMAPTSASESLTYGQKLIVLKFDSLVGDDGEKIPLDDAKLLKDSLNSRLAFEAAVDEINQLEVLQEWRLRTEKSSHRAQGDLANYSAPLVANETPNHTAEDPTRSSSTNASSLDQVRIACLVPF
jgi:hypothetical protein